MVIGLDGVDIGIVENTIDLSEHKPKDEKYVYAVDHKVDMIVTEDRNTAVYFRENGIAALLKV